MWQSLEVQRTIEELEGRLPECFVNVRRGPRERKFNTAGYQIPDKYGNTIFHEYTEAQKDILYWGWELGLRRFSRKYRHQEYLINLLLKLSKQTGDPKDVLYRFMIQVTTSFNFVLMDKRNLSDHSFVLTVKMD
jgi:hypothetical protein